MLSLSIPIESPYPGILAFQDLEITSVDAMPPGAAGALLELLSLPRGPRGTGMPAPHLAVLLHITECGVAAYSRTDVNDTQFGFC